jgi:hypothetical protein
MRRAKFIHYVKDPKGVRVLAKKKSLDIEQTAHEDKVDIKGHQHAFLNNTITFHRFGLTRAKFHQCIEFYNDLAFDECDASSAYTPLSMCDAYQLNTWRAMWEMPKGGLYVVFGNELMFIPRYTIIELLKDSVNGGISGQWLFASKRWRHERYNRIIEYISGIHPQVRRAPLINVSQVGMFKYCKACFGRGKYDWISRLTKNNGREDEPFDLDYKEKYYIFVPTPNTYLKIPFLKNAEEHCSDCGGVGIDFSDNIRFENGFAEEGKTMKWRHGPSEYTANSFKRKIKRKADKNGKFENSFDKERWGDYSWCSD